MKQDFDVSSDWAASWNGSIAIKVTAVTIWVILIASFAVTLPFVSSFEESSSKEYSWQRLRVEEVIHANAVDKADRAELIGELGTVLKDTDIKYLAFNYYGDEVSLGISAEGRYTVSSFLTDNLKDNGINVIFEFPSLHRAILLARVKVGSAIVGFSVIFGMFLFWINKHIVHTPFEAIIELTQKISAGDKHHRLDTSRGDEFGVLAKFLNAMLDALESNEQALKKVNTELLEEIRNREEALAASQQKSAFLANMSHEIRTPLSSILGYTERIRFDKVKSVEDEKQMLDIVLQNGNHLLHLINDILDLSKVEANKLEIEKSSFSIVRVAEHTRRLLADKAMEQNTELRVEYEFPIPESIHSDPVRSKQILLNLVSNAIRFTHNGSVTVRLSYDRETDYLNMEVKDTGIGMTEAEQANLFMPFCQADASISRKYGGTGLGLTISKRLAELMGGDISAQSIKGLGSRFCCYIKAGFDEQVDKLITSIEGLDLGMSDYEKPVEGIALEGRVLLVEDTPEIQQLVKAYMEDYGVDIDTAANGEEGVRKALENADQYDLVLMDIQMPVMNGKEAARKLRAANFSKPIIALTADALAQHAADFHTIGFTDTLTKPIITNDLLAVLQSYLDASVRAIVDDTRAVEIEARPAMSLSDSDPAVNKIKANFIVQLPGYVESLVNALQEDNLAEAHAVLHKLKGIGGSLGYPEVSQLAGEISDFLSSNDLLSANKKIEEIIRYYQQNNSIG